MLGNINNRYQLGNSPFSRDYELPSSEKYNIHRNDNKNYKRDLSDYEKLRNDYKELPYDVKTRKY